MTPGWEILASSGFSYATVLRWTIKFFDFLYLWDTSVAVSKHKSLENTVLRLLTCYNLDSRTEIYIRQILPPLGRHIQSGSDTGAHRRKLLSLGRDDSCEMQVIDKWTKQRNKRHCFQKHSLGLPGLCNKDPLILWCISKVLPLVQGNKELFPFPRFQVYIYGVFFLASQSWFSTVRTVLWVCP